jgi:hypothetical protein
MLSLAPPDILSAVPILTFVSRQSFQQALNDWFDNMAKLSGHIWTSYHYHLLVS